MGSVLVLGPRGAAELGAGAGADVGAGVDAGAGAGAGLLLYLSDSYSLIFGDSFDWFLYEKLA